MITSRELATLILLSAFLLWTLPRRDVREAMAGVIRSFLAPKVLVVFLLYAAYIAALIWIAATINVWERGLLKDTIVWFTITGFPLLMKFGDASKEENFFWRTARSTIALSVFVVFFVNVVSFHLLVELVLQSILTILTLMVVTASLEKKYERVKRLGEAIISTIAVVLIGVTTVQVTREWDQLDLPLLGRSLALTIWLPLAALPFIYGFALLSGYEMAFLRMRYMNNRRPPSLKSKLATLLTLNGQVRAVHSFAGGWAGRTAEASSFRAARERVREYRRHRNQQRAEQVAREERLRRFAGVDGTDAHGKRLDQREFDETKDALRWLATCHKGWYRNQDGGYRSDLLDLLGSFTSRRLPEEHNIVMNVRLDGGAWYAWRRTTTGWVFAIGAATEPPDQWLYDRADPPMDFPGTGVGWEQFGAGPGAPNW